MLLQAVLLCAGEEAHVLHATGPVLLTAVYYAFRDAGVAPSPSVMALAGVGRNRHGVMVPAVLASGVGTLVWVPDSQHVGPPGTKPGCASAATRV